MNIFVSKFREQKVYILRGTVVVAPVKYTEKKKRKKEAEKKYTNVLDYVEWLICKFGAIVAVIEPFIKLDDSIYYADLIHRFRTIVTWSRDFNAVVWYFNEINLHFERDFNLENEI